MAPVSHSILRNRPIAGERILNSHDIRIFDDFANFYRSHRSELNCQQPPCIDNDDIANSITYLIVKRTMESSASMQQLYRFLHSDKRNLIEAGIQDNTEVLDEIRYGTVFAGVDGAKDRLAQKHSNLGFFLDAAVEPIQVYIDILTALSQN